MSLTAAEFGNLRYGLFIHYGLYSLLGRGEWVLNREQIPMDEYRSLAQRFTAERFDADALCRMAKQAGMRYIVLTTMHHEGFRLYNTALSDFCAPKTPARRDLIAEMVAACRKHGLYIGLYHSLNIWTEKPDAVDALERKEDYDVFIRKTFDRVRELVTIFNPIDVLWYDGHWPFGAQGWQAEAMNEMVRKIQPHILFNNRNGLPGDFGTPEQHLTAPNPWRPFECCVTLNDSWCYQPGDHNWKTPGQVVAQLATMAQRRGNLLLNIGPKGDGSVPDESLHILKTVGEWLDRCGECIYDTDEFCFEYGSIRKETNYRGDWMNRGPMTARGNNLYILMRRWPGSAGFALAGLNAKVQSASLIGMQRRPVKFMQEGSRVKFLDLPDAPTDPLCTVLRLECDRPPSVYLCGGMRTPTVRHWHYDVDPAEPAPHAR